MILSFSTQINGKKTHFPEKILKCIEENKLSDEPLKWGIASKHHHQKIHTIRKDEKNRWKVGTMIDFYINARTKDMYCFAPRIPVVSIQKIRIKYTKSSKNTPLIYVEVFGNNDFKCLDTYNPELQITSFKIIEKLALNDGFESVEDFFSYFNEDFEGKIIHWTKTRY